MFSRFTAALVLWFLIIYLEAIHGVEYMGCYVDTLEDRVFPWENITTDDNSIKSCGLHCKGNGFVYFGVQVGTQCFCGTDLDFANRGTARPDSECNRACSGNSAEICGGSYRISVYRAGRIATITASSEHGSGDHSPTYARLNFNQEVTGTVTGAWSAGENNADQWLMFDLGQRSSVGVLRTQGRESSQYYSWVTSYSISYGNSSGDEMWYKDANGDTIVFTGNNDSSSLVTHVLTDYSGPFHARYVKFNVVTWNRWVAMRADVGEVAPVGFWPLNRHTQLRDVSGYGNDATGVGVSLDNGVHGESEGAYNFSGSSTSYIEIPNNGALDTRYSVTILAYVYPTGTDGPIVNYRINNYGVHLWQQETNKLYARMATRDHVYTNYIKVTTLNLNQWNFVGLTYSYPTVKLKGWHDGIEVGSVEVGAIETETQYDIRVGYLDGDARAFEGRIACIQIYNIPLNGDQIRDAAGKCTAAQPVGLWRLNKQYGLTDTSGNGNDATGEGVALGTGVYGEPEGSYVLSGNSNSYIEIPNDRTLDTRYSLTILASVYPTGQSGPLLHYGDNATGIHMWQDSTYFLNASLFSRNATTSQTSQTRCLKPDQWNFVGLTYDYNSGILKLWYEGLEISSTDIGVYQLGTNHAVRIGAVGADSYSGSVSCVQIYNVALNQSQIEHAATLCTGKSIALGKPATQSSDYVDYTLASNAVDGYKGPVHPTITHTQIEFEPWWKLDLGGIYIIERVRLLNRRDSVGNRLEEFQVRVGEDSDISKNSVCGRTTNQLDHPPEDRSITVDCDQPIIGRYVSVQLIGRTNILTLSEVEVFVAQGKDAGWLTLDFSSVISSAGTPHDDGGTVYDAYKTRDGNLSTYWHPTGVTDNQYFITFDLQEYYWLSKIRVIGYEEDDAATHHIAAFTIKTALNTTGSWTDVTSFSGLAGRQVKAFTGFVARSRYWRVDITQTSHGLEPYVAEIQLYGYLVSSKCSAASQEELTYHCNSDKPSYVTMATSGTITSGDDGWGNYSSDSLCSWTIEAPSGKNVSLTFLTFDLADDGDCLSDYVAVYDGSSQSSALLGRFCESNPGVVNSTGNLMHVTFVTNSVLQASGFRASFKRLTEPTDECATGNGGCAQNCTDTVDSFFCSCLIVGYKLNDDCLSCDDVDECATGNGGCAQNCTNTVGSFSCSCQTGYILNDDGVSCNDTDECASNNGGCSVNCNNTIGSFECYCGDGYVLDGDGVSCNDIDECANANGGCEHVCTNTEGSFQCSCHLGQTLNGDGLNCDGWDLPESCPTVGNLSLPNNKTYVAQSDVNELVNYTTAQGRCAAEGRMIAVPRDWNEQEYLVFYKSCLAGGNAKFWLGLSRPNGTWVDGQGTALGEFAAWAPGEPDKPEKLCSHLVHETITNSKRKNKWADMDCSTSMRYICETDVDECATGNGGCAQNCTNTIGSFSCSCYTGYKFNNDGVSCDDIDECTSNNGGCSVNCNNTIGSFECYCGDGYVLDGDGVSCNDIDECANANGDCEHVCTNTEGSFQCSCHLGQTLNGDGKNCDGWDLPESCPTVGYLSLPNNKTYVAQSDVNELVNYTTAQARCAAEWRMIAVPRDWNEQEYLVFYKNCLAGHAQFWLGLSRPNGAWVYGQGTALGEFAAWAPGEPNEPEKLCSHLVFGTQPDSERRNKWSDIDCSTSMRYICETDVDECATGNGGCAQNCTNTVGSFSCSCYTGYEFNNDGVSCDDIDECVSNNGGCSVNCNNTIGSFECYCGDGYVLDGDGVSCNVLQTTTPPPTTPVTTTTTAAASTAVLSTAGLLYQLQQPHSQPRHPRQPMYQVLQHRPVPRQQGSPPRPHHQQP
ncbi:uncharacterized protein LOC144911074 isoform X2 [Branchiostoma floridae x Branchiostoma belcheri]